MALVNWSQTDAFVQAILPDVTIGPAITTANGFATNEYVELSDVYTTSAAAINARNPQSDTTDDSPLLPFASNAYGIRRERLAMQRALPEPHPILRVTSRFRVYAVAAEVIQGVGYPAEAGAPGDTQRIQFYTGGSAANDGKGKVLVTYRSLPYCADIPDAQTNIANHSEIERYVSRQCTPSGENLPMAGTGYRFMIPSGGPGGLGGGVDIGVVPAGLTRILPKVHLVYTWYMVPIIPRAAQVFLGKLNAEYNWDPASGNASAVVTDFGMLRDPFGRGTVLYTTCDISKPYFTCTGTRVFDIAYHCIFRSNRANWTDAGLRVEYAAGHNFFLHPPSGDWRRISYRGRAVAGALPPWPMFDYPPIYSTLSQGPARGLYDYVKLLGLFKLDGAVVP